MADENKLDQILEWLWAITKTVASLDERLAAVEWSKEETDRGKIDLIEPWQRLERTPEEEKMAAYNKKEIFKITQSMSGWSKKAWEISFYSKWEWWMKQTEKWKVKDNILTWMVFDNEADAVRYLNKKDPNRRTNNSYWYVKSLLYSS